MVTKWGLSEKLGPLMYAEEEGEVFLGRSAGSQHANVSGETAKLIDEEVRSIIDHRYGTAKQILTENRDKLDMMAEALMKYETIDAPQIDDIMAGRPPREPRDWEGGGTGTSGRRPCRMTIVRRRRLVVPPGSIEGSVDRTFIGRLSAACIQKGRIGAPSGVNCPPRCAMVVQLAWIASPGRPA